MIVKVCGMREGANIRQVDAIAGVDWMGFIFYPPSPRHVDAVPEYMPRRCRRVGVTVDMPPSEVAGLVTRYGLHLVQLHGDETAQYCATLRAELPRPIQLIKTLATSTLADLRRADAFHGTVDYLLFETPCDGRGGSGRQFDWSLLDLYDGPTPFLLTGGIGPDDYTRIASLSHPRLAGIDLNSRFETRPAVKDPAAIERFIHHLNHHQQ